MCGISGIFSPARPLVAAALDSCRRMNAAMLHRGPDEEGFYEDEGLVLGHRRLSIIDLSAGQQPMHSGCGDYTVVFNGEIYNFPELRAELQAMGHSFRTRSDTEVILEGYKAWDREVLGHLRGMFAFVLYDKPRRLILGARDPIGKKPLYFHCDGGELRFASELESLRAGGSLSDRVSMEAAGLYFSLGFIPAPLCIYADARKLEAGQAFLFSRGGLELWRYWDIPMAPRLETGEAENLQWLDGLLDHAVRKRLMSEVPLGAFLSGGVDSNLVVSAMAKVSPTPVKTYTAGFGGRSHLPGVRDERELAAAAASHYGTVHREINLSPADAGPLLPDLVRHLGEPLADPSILPTYLVCREARRSVTVVLTGDGGDEPFGGYSFRYLPHLREQRLRRFIPRVLARAAAAALGPAAKASASLRRVCALLANLSVSPEEAFYRDLSPLTGLGRVLQGPLQTAPGSAFKLVETLYRKAAGRDELTRILYVDTRLYMCENVLVKADRMSMAASLELRSPLLDDGLVSFAFSLPAGLKIRGHECKYLLRRLAKDKIAPGLADQPKTGFSFPVEEFLRGAWRGDFESRTLGPASPLSEYLDPSALAGQWRAFLAGDDRPMRFLWSAYIFAIWHKDVFQAKT